MSLRRMCRELVLKVVVRNSIGTTGDDELEPTARLQLVVDERTQAVLNSFLGMTDLLDEGVASLELIELEREPLPEVDALYLLEPSDFNVGKLLQDFQLQNKPQHAQVHLAFVRSTCPSASSGRRLALDQLPRLASGPFLPARVKSFVEVPVSFLPIQDRGFHFNMPDAIKDLFPDPTKPTGEDLIKDIACRLVDVCRCLDAHSPNIRHAASSKICRDVALGVKRELDVYRPVQLEHQPNKPDVGAITTELLIVDRSIDMAATLVHEYTYEACAYDVLDGGVLDIDRNIVYMNPNHRKAPVAKHEKHRQSWVGGGRRNSSADSPLNDDEDNTPESGTKNQKELLSDADPLFQELRHLHVQAAKQLILDRIQDLQRQKLQDDLNRQDGGGFDKLLEQLRKDPQHAEQVRKLELHQHICAQMVKETHILSLRKSERDIGLGNLEQDMATGVDLEESSVRPQVLLEHLRNTLTANDVPEDKRLRLLLLYFSSMAGISVDARTKLLQESRLKSSDQDVLREFTRLMEAPDAPKPKSGGTVHRASKEQIAKFKKICKDRVFDLSRFEPRVKQLLQQMIAGTLKEDIGTQKDEVFPSVSELDLSGMGPRTAGTKKVEAPPAPSFDDWSFEPTAAPTVDASTEVTRRIIIFLIGGVTYSELRCVAEVATPGVEILVGGTSIMTPKRLIKMLRSSAEKDNVPDDDDPLNLT